MLCAQLPRAAVATCGLGTGAARVAVPTSSPRRARASSAALPSSPCTAAAMAMGRRRHRAATCGRATGHALAATTTSLPPRWSASSVAAPSPWVEVLGTTTSAAGTVVPRTAARHRRWAGTGRRQVACLRLVLEEEATCGLATGRALAATTTSSPPRRRASSAALPSPWAALLAATADTAVARVPTAVVQSVEAVPAVPCAAVPAVLRAVATAAAVAMGVTVATAVLVASAVAVATAVAVADVADALMAVRSLPAPLLPFRSIG